MNRVRLPFPTDRGGLTLAEILISLLVMSIGVVSVATLFPLSVVRAVQGTNITNATHLAFNAEAVLRSFPELQYGGGKWNYGTTVTLGTPPTYIVPSETIKYGDFPGYILRATRGGTTGSLEPNWDSTTSGTVTDGSAQWVAFIQDGDLFQWKTPVASDISATNPGTSAVLRTLKVPTSSSLSAPDATIECGPYLIWADHAILSCTLYPAAFLAKHRVNI